MLDKKGAVIKCRSKNVLKEYLNMFISVKTCDVDIRKDFSAGKNLNFKMKIYEYYMRFVNGWKTWLKIMF